MLDILTRKWWAIALRGVAALVFGILAFVWPGASLAALVLLFGAYVLVDGVFSVVASFSGGREGRRWWVLLLEGLVGIAAGLITFAVPGFTALALLYVIGAWAIITGILEISEALQLRRVITGEWALIAGGILSIVFGVLLFFRPAAGALAIAWLLGAYAIVFGLTMLALSFRLRRWGREAPEIRARAA